MVIKYRYEANAEEQTAQKIRFSHKCVQRSSKIVVSSDSFGLHTTVHETQERTLQCTQLVCTVSTGPSTVKAGQANEAWPTW